ncbi:MAG: amidohydrolase family protein [Phycisphaerales bacterium JB043]
MRLISSLCLTSLIASLNLSCATLAQDREPTPGNEGITRHLNSGGEPLTPAPDRDGGEGPFERLVIRGATLIDGTGAPPVGPVDIVIEGNRITKIQSVGNPGAPIDPDGRPEAGDHEIDAHGMYVLPGFINCHAHIGNLSQWEYGEAAPAEYVYKLWLAHGITTVRDVGSFNGLDWTMSERERSSGNEIIAPRIFAYAGFPSHLTPDEATGWVQAIHDAGADGIKFFGAPIETMRAALAKARELGLRTTMHHAQLNVVDLNVLDSARMGLTSMEHWYGLPEALFEDKRIQHYPPDYNYNNEQHRFGEAGRLWAQAAEPGSEKWNAVMDELLALDFTLDPTFSIYEASRDVMRARNADWMADYCWPSLWEFFQPSRTAHGSFWLDWTTADEIAWKNNFRKWMGFVNEYKNRGGRVTTGEDAGFIYKVYGFAYIRELEMLQEAGFHPLEVIRSATRNGAELLGRSDDLGTVQRGRLADLVIVDENPVHNLKVLYATGAVRFDDERGAMTRVGGISHTIKDGIIYDAKQLAQQVRQMVAAQHAAE